MSLPLECHFSGDDQDTQQRRLADSTLSFDACSTLFSPIKPVPTSESSLFGKKTFKQEKEERKINMSEWVVLDISGITKTTKSDRVIKILKEVKLLPSKHP